LGGCGLTDDGRRCNNPAMLASVADVRGALAELAEDELEVLFATSQLRPAPSMALASWVEHAVDWELNRRKGFDFRLAPPDEAIDPSEDTVAISVAIALHDEFAGDPAIARFFAAAVEILIGRGQCR
jgi:hypothetical protein